MPNQPRFPQEDSKFNDYLQNAEPYLQTNWTRLVPAPAPPGISPSPAGEPARAGTDGGRGEVAAAPADPRKAQLLDYFTQWNSLFPRSQNSNTRTKTITEDKDALRKNIEALLRGIFADIPQSFLTTADRETLNLPKRDTTPTHHTTPITDVPEFSMFPLGGGDIKFHVRTSHDATRASKLLGAEIEMLYIMLLLEEPHPNHVNELTKSNISTKSVFVFHCGTQNTGKILYCAVRWVVLSDPSRNGPWTNIQQVTVA